MIGINKVIILGYLGADPDIKYMSNGNSLTNIVVATKYPFKDRSSGAFSYKTEWHRVVLYGKLSDTVSSFLRKGIKVYLEGSLKSNKWKDKDGKTCFNIDIVASTLQVLDSKLNNGDSSSVDKDSFLNRNKNEKVFEEDIPF